MSYSMNRIATLLFLLASLPGCSLAWLLADASDASPAGGGGGSAVSTSTATTTTTGAGGGHECKGGETLKCACPGDGSLEEASCENGTWSACPCPSVPDAGGTGGGVGAKDAGTCVPTKTCADNPQGGCADLDDGCGHALDCSQTCGEAPWITCQGNTCTCQREASQDVACANTIGPAYNYGVRCSGNGGPVPGVPADCLPMATGALGPSSLWCCGTVM